MWFVCLSLFIESDDEILWTQHGFEQTVLTARDVPKDIETELLQNVMVLLVTGTKIETLAIHSYLQPLDGHINIYRFIQAGQEAEVVTYYIGKYGACLAAVRDTSSSLEMHDSTSSISTMADQCFPNLGVIISVGVACGIKDKVKMFDVLVSSKVVNYDAGKDGDEVYSLRGESITVSSQLNKLFTQPKEWPSDVIKKFLNDDSQFMPNVKSGVILSGPLLVDDPAMKRLSVKSFAHEAIGIEMYGTHSFMPSQQTTMNGIIVKAVCDFGDGRHNKKYKLAAAILAADLVHQCLSDLQASEKIKGLHNVFV